MLDWPVNPDIIINGSDNKIALAARPVKPITPQLLQYAHHGFYKTGRPADCGSYVAFIPEKELGIVMLAVKLSQSSELPPPGRFSTLYSKNFIGSNFPDLFSTFSCCHLHLKKTSKETFDTPAPSRCRSDGAVSGRCLQFSYTAAWHDRSE